MLRYLSNNLLGRPLSLIYDFKRAGTAERRRLVQRSSAPAHLLIWLLHECDNAVHEGDPRATLPMAEEGLEVEDIRAELVREMVKVRQRARQRKELKIHTGLVCGDGGNAASLGRTDYDDIGGHAAPSIRTMHTEDIGIARLRARPVAELCIDCKSEQEKLERRTG